MGLLRNLLGSLGLLLIPAIVFGESAPVAESEPNPAQPGSGATAPNDENLPAVAGSDEDADAASRGVSLEQVTVSAGRLEDLVGIASSASQGYVGHQELETRPLLRAGELLEAIPGAIVTQHSGSGKANQYFLRGFNLDHGTDFRVDVDGMPVNMPTHGHGQGYADINFIIPELIDHIEYKKGVYYAETGDFSSAGSAEFSLADSLPRGLALVGVGTDDFYRAVAADSFELSSGNKLLLGVETQYYDGPWDVAEDAQKVNGIVRYSWGDTGHERFRITAMAYHGVWNSADQIPQRAVEQGLVSDLGVIDSTDGGRSSRDSLQADWLRVSDTEEHRANIYALYYKLNLFSNFTYFLDDPVNGDQFAQIDNRTVLGGATSHKYIGSAFGRDSTTEFGAQLRHDIIPKVALYKTRDRQILSTVRNDDVKEFTTGVYVKNETQLTDSFRSVFGLRGDIFYFDVNSEDARNSGNEFDGKLSPKGSLIYGVTSDTELYLSGGLGFHSNDARGVTIRVDPVSGESTDRVDPLVLSKGAELGLRTNISETLSSTLALWVLNLDSELLFVGDAGNTEASRESRREGVEWANYYKPFKWLNFDLDLALTRARFQDTDPVGDHIPGAIATVLTSGVTLQEGPEGAFGTLRIRHFGPRPLIEDNSIESDSTTLVNAEAGYRLGQVEVALQALNLFDSNDHDIDYFYPSRLPGEPEGGIDDIHFHPVEPFQLRGVVTYRF